MTDNFGGRATAGIAPLAIAIYPALFLLARNVDQIEIEQATRSIALSLLLMAGALAAGLLFTHDWTKAALLTSGLLFFFFSYGHAYEFLKVAANPLARHRYLLPLWGLLLAGWGYLLLRSRDPSNISSWSINIVAIALLLFPGVSLVSRSLPQSRLDQSKSLIRSSEFSPIAGGDLPDIYYIVLDGYGRQDILRDLYDYDNSEFISGLEAMGFTVLDRSWSNYSLTSLSLAATLNLDYVNDLAAAMGPESRDSRPLGALIGNSAVREVLKQHGYQFVAFETGLPLTSIENADVYLKPDFSESRDESALLVGLELNQFEGMLLGTTVARVALDHYIRSQSEVGDFLTGYPYQLHRNRILFTISSLSDFAQIEGNHFVFAHVISPHAPFVFGENGEAASNLMPFSLQDAGCCTRDEYMQGYRNQATFIGSLVRLEVAEILARSEISPIIIIQGDHGPGAFLKVTKSDSNLKERFGILNALHLPGDVSFDLDPSLSPVNTFRIVLNEYFEGELEMLTSESFFATGVRPYDLEAVDQEELSAGS